MSFRLSITLPVTLLAATLFLSPLWAQGRGGGRSAPSRGGSRGGRMTPGYRYGRRGQYGQYGEYGQYYPGWGWGYLPPPYFDLDNDYDYGPDEPEAPPAPEVVMQPPAQPWVRRPAPAASPATSLLLERHGDQWVRIEQSATASPAVPTRTAQASTLPSVTAGPSEASQPPHQLPPAVLVFRDGHSEELERYSIIGGIIYTTADYWSTGTWTRKIPIAELDVPATLKQNQVRGGKFALPSGPNEVVIQP